MNEYNFIFKGLIQYFHHFIIKNPKAIDNEEPSRLTIKGENLLILVTMIGNSSFNIEDCNINPINILHTNSMIKGHLRFQLPSCEDLKSL